MKNGTRLVALLVALLLLASGCSIIKIGQDSSNGDDGVLAEMKRKEAEQLQQRQS